MFTINYKNITKPFKITVVLLFSGFTFAALGSIGGGSKAKTSSILKADFAPIRTSRGFTLRSGLKYTGSINLKDEKIGSIVTYNSLVTYQKGNTTYILPNHYKVSYAAPEARNNLQLLNLKIKLCK